MKYKITTWLLGLYSATLWANNNESAIKNLTTQVTEPSSARIFLIEPSDEVPQFLSDCDPIISVRDSLLLSDLSLFSISEIFGLPTALPDEILVARKIKDTPVNSLDIDGEIIHIKVDRLKHYSYRVIELPIADWTASPVMETLIPYFEQFPVSGTCSVPKALTYHSSDLTVKTPEPFQDWRSVETNDNQLKYDDELFDFFKILYGNKGLGYGDHVKSGIHLNVKPKAFGANWSYNQFSLIWSIEGKELDQIVKAVIPNSIILNADTSWSSSCQQIRLRFSAFDDFSTASPYLANQPENCETKPLFNHDGFATFPLVPEEKLLESFLVERNRLNHITFVLNENLQNVPCEQLDTLTIKGCSQKVVQALEDTLFAFMRKESELYLEIEFGQLIKKTYHLDSVTGVIEEILPRLPIQNNRMKF
ncbi:MAG: hypothetical protein GY787_13395 [Alteromonadales bacterium]|nr:hypothetical protein [Alteromonadales bacterium]